MSRTIDKNGLLSLQGSRGTAVPLQSTLWPHSPPSVVLTMPPRSDAYSLIVRQGPERAKAFSGPKEKGTLASRADLW